MQLKFASWVRVNPECLDDIPQLRKYLNHHTEIKTKVFNKIQKDASKVASNYASVVLDLISAKKEIESLKKQILKNNANKNSDYYS